jgi:Asp-tRNA(Asn)/Glu-tRNA(Gln) amidotransferase A subunit family amidase
LASAQRVFVQQGYAGATLNAIAADASLTKGAVYWHFASKIEQHLFQWDRFRRTRIRFMANYDVMITPAAAATAKPHGAPEGSIFYTLTYGLTGYPAVVVRVGATAKGLPIGVQVGARPWREDVALAVAHYLETHLGGWHPPENYEDLG